MQKLFSRRKSLSFLCMRGRGHVYFFSVRKVGCCATIWPFSISEIYRGKRVALTRPNKSSKLVFRRITFQIFNKYIFKIGWYVYKYSSVPNKRPVRSYYFSKKSTLCALIRHYSIIMILPCAFINFCDIFHPVRLLSPVRLLGTPKYTVKLTTFSWSTKFSNVLSLSENVGTFWAERILGRIVSTKHFQKKFFDFGF